MSAPVALVTGATGAVGPALARLLASEGWRVRGLARTPPPPRVLPPGSQFFEADITDAKAFAKAAEGATVVFHLAAKLHVYSPPAAAADEYRRVNLEGTRAVAEGVRWAGVPRMVMLSTANVYGPSTPAKAHTEEAPLRARGLYEQTKAQAEEAVARAFPGATVLRPAAVYGPRMKGNYLRMARAVARGRFLLLGSGVNRRTLVHEDDLARACLLAASHPHAIGRTYNVTDGGTPTFGDIVQAIARAAGRPPPALRFPLAPARWAVAAAETGFRLAHRRPPLTVEALDKLVEDMAVSGDRIQVELGFRPAHDLDGGWRATFAAWRAQGGTSGAPRPGAVLARREGSA